MTERDESDEPPVAPDEGGAREHDDTAPSEHDDTAPSEHLMEVHDPDDEVSQPPEPLPDWAVFGWSYSGPIPLPRFADGWEQLVPGAADRILSMAEREQAQRHRMDERALTMFGRGQWFAFILGMTALAVGCVAIVLDKDAVGVATIISALAVLALAFVWGRGGSQEPPPPSSPPDGPEPQDQPDAAESR